MEKPLEVRSHGGVAARASEDEKSGFRQGRVRKARRVRVLAVVGMAVLVAGLAACVTQPRPPPAASINGSPVVGATLTVSPGNWYLPATSFTYAWYRCTGLDFYTDCNNTGETQKTYTVTAADQGLWVWVIITGYYNGEAGGTTGAYVGPITARGSAGSGASRQLRAGSGSRRVCGLGPVPSELDEIPTQSRREAVGIMATTRTRRSGAPVGTVAIFGAWRQRRRLPTKYVGQRASSSWRATDVSSRCGRCSTDLFTTCAETNRRARGRDAARIRVAQRCRSVPAFGGTVLPSVWSMLIRIKGLDSGSFAFKQDKPLLSSLLTEESAAPNRSAMPRPVRSPLEIRPSVDTPDTCWIHALGPEAHLEPVNLTEVNPELETPDAGLHYSVNNAHGIPGNHHDRGERHDPRDGSPQPETTAERSGQADGADDQNAGGWEALPR